MAKKLFVEFVAYTSITVEVPDSFDPEEDIDEVWDYVNEATLGEPDWEISEWSQVASPEETK